MCGACDAEWSMSLCWLETRVRAGVLKNSSSGRVTSPQVLVVITPACFYAPAPFVERSSLGERPCCVETASVIDGRSVRASAGLRGPVESGLS